MNVQRLRAALADESYTFVSLDPHDVERRSVEERDDHGPSRTIGRRGACGILGVMGRNVKPAIAGSGDPVIVHGKRQPEQGRHPHHPFRRGGVRTHARTQPHVD